MSYLLNVHPALWWDITGFLTSLSGLLGDQSFSASYLFWQISYLTSHHFRSAVHYFRLREKRTIKAPVRRCWTTQHIYRCRATPSPPLSFPSFRQLMHTHRQIMIILLSFSEPLFYVCLLLSKLFKLCTIYSILHDIAQRGQRCWYFYTWHVAGGQRTVIFKALKDYYYCTAKCWR